MTAYLQVSIFSVESGDLAVLWSSIEGFLFIHSFIARIYIVTLQGTSIYSGVLLIHLWLLARHCGVSFLATCNMTLVFFVSFLENHSV